MRFLLILTHIQKAWEEAPPGEPVRVYEQYMALEQDLRREGKLVDSVRLRPCGEAKTLRNLPGNARKLDNGPFFQSSESIGGYYVLECQFMDEALEWAKRMPNYGHGAIEVRPIWD